jgi:hypothetical protein
MKKAAIKYSFYFSKNIKLLSFLEYRFDVYLYRTFFVLDILCAQSLVKSGSCFVDHIQKKKNNFLASFNFITIKQVARTPFITLNYDTRLSVFLPRFQRATDINMLGILVKNTFMHFIQQHAKT